MRLNCLTLAVAFTSCLVCCQPTDKTSECIKLPDKSSSQERESSTKLKADLVGKIASPSLEETYKAKLDDAYAELSQKTLEQLVLIEFLVCVKKYHAADLSPETIDTMDKALQRAINKAAGAQSLTGGISAQSKEVLKRTNYGDEKLDALNQLGD